MARLRLVNPGDDASYVDVPVIMQISFANKDKKGPGVEHQHVHGFDPSADSGRYFHMFRVMNASGPVNQIAYDSYNYIDVERIECFPHVTKRTEYDVVSQVYGWLTGNTDLPGGWPAQPGDLENSAAEYLRQVVRCTFDNTVDGDPWVDMEIIRFKRTIDKKTHNNPELPNAQERAFRIPWFTDPLQPVGDDDDPYKPLHLKCDKSLPLLDEATTGMDFGGINDNSKQSPYGDERRFRATGYPPPTALFSGGPPDTAPGDPKWPSRGFRMPSPLQNIVNCDFGGPFLILDAVVDWVNGNDGKLGGMSINTPAAPLADPPLPALNPAFFAPTFPPLGLLSGASYKLHDDPKMKITSAINSKMRKNFVMMGLPIGPFTSTGPPVDLYLIGMEINGKNVFVNFAGTFPQYTDYINQLKADGTKITSTANIDRTTPADITDNVVEIGVNFEGDITHTVTTPGHGHIYGTTAVNLARFLPKRGPGEPEFTGSIAFKVLVPHTAEQAQDFFAWGVAVDFNHPDAHVPPHYTGYVWNFSFSGSSQEFDIALDYFKGQLSASGLTVTETRFAGQVGFYPQTASKWSLTASTWATRNNFPYDQNGLPKYDRTTGKGYATAAGAGDNIALSGHVDPDNVSGWIEDPLPPDIVHVVTVKFPSLEVSIS